MHNSDSFISEVSEAVRRDRLTQALRRYGWIIGALVLVIVGGAAWTEYAKWRDARTAAVAGDAMTAALADQDPGVRAAALGAFADQTPRAAAVARLAEAGSLEAAGDAETAADVLATLADSPGTTDLYRALAALQRVMVLGPKLDASERMATLEALVAPGAPFRPLALEQRALARLEAGDKPGAITDFEAILTEPTASQALQGRARQLIVAAGGSLPVAPVGIPTPVPTGDPADVPADG